MTQNYLKPQGQFQDKLYERIGPRFEYAILFLMGGQVHQSVACILRVDWLSN